MIQKHENMLFMRKVKLNKTLVLSSPIQSFQRPKIGGTVNSLAFQVWSKYVKINHMKIRDNFSPTGSEHLYHTALKSYRTYKIHPISINKPFSGGHHAN